MKPRRQLRLLSRYLPRRFLYTILYGAFILFLVFFYRKVAFELSRSPAYNVKNNGDAYDEAGEQIPAHLRKTEDGVDPFLGFRSLPKKDWLDRDFYEREQQRQGNGEQGRPLKLDPAEVKDNETMSKLMDQLYRANGYNAYISDQIPLDRSVKDIRHEGCKTKQYIERLPSVSVILPYHDEHYSTLLRSGYSILNRSPRDVLREIIFVDDASSKPDLLEPFEQHWRTKGLDGIVKVVRTSKREGLIRARAIGARAARGDILVFLDSHSEANYNWLPPLVEPIALNYRTVVCPFVDVIDCDTYEYRAQDEGARGSFDWEFNYKRLPLTKEDLQRPTEPFKSPVMAGGYFAISTKWFWELGGYDEGLDIWGGEQYELSFKIWQCHGQLVDAPCSRVGHIYRCKYVPFGNPGVGDFISRNYRRVAEVWMDEHREHLYKRRTALRTADAGDLSKQKAVRARLKCKTFDWFMREIAFDQDHFYPAVEPPDGANGQIRSVATGKCLDSGFKGSGEKLELNTCKSEHPEVKGEQDFRFSFWEDVRPKGRSVCLDVAENHAKAPLKLFACHGMKGNQHFKYRPGTKQLMHKLTNQCLDSDAAGVEVFMNGCSVEAPTQRWEWAKVDAGVLEEWEQKAAAEEQLKNGRRR